LFACTNTNALFSAPVRPPQNVSNLAQNSTTVILEWTEPSFSDRNGIVRLYRIIVCQIEPRESNMYNTTTESLQLKLHPYYRYSWTVAAYTVAWGPSSEPTEFQMPEDGQSYYIYV